MKPLTKEQVLEIRHKAAVGLSTKWLAKEYNRSESHIRNLVNGTIRPEVGGLLRGRDY